VLVKEVELAAAAFDAKSFVKASRPEVAFIGRSNVGKSSLINTSLNRKNLARTSSTPGKTQALYFYLVNRSFYLVDLPGYGYARVSKEVRRRWAPLIEGYLRERESLCGCVHLIDSRHPPTADDLLMAEWLRHYRLPTITVATKADKLSRGAQKQRLALIRRELKLAAEEPLLLFSAVTGQGREELWRHTCALISGGFSDTSGNGRGK